MIDKKVNTKPSACAPISHPNHSKSDVLQPSMCNKKYIGSLLSVQSII